MFWEAVGLKCLPAGLCVCSLSPELVVLFGGLWNWLAEVGHRASPLRVRVQPGFQAVLSAS